jgi:hypothetical protein
MEDDERMGLSRLVTSKGVQYIAWFCLVYWLIVVLSVVLTPVVDYKDYAEYINLVNGRISEVHQPFVGRILAPMIARLAVVSTGVSPSWALGVTSAVGWAIVPILGGAFLSLRKVPIGWALVIASVPFPAQAARFLLVPDGWPICLILTIFIAIETRRGALAGVAAFVLALTRTSSILAVTLRLVADFRKNKYRLAAVIFAAFFAGLLLKIPLLSGNPGNQHKMPGIIYMLAKAPVNGLSNIVGMHIYTNTYPYCPKPSTTLELGKVVGFGDVHTIGLCPIFYPQIYTSFACYVFIFGLLPFIAARHLFRERLHHRNATDFAWREITVFLAAFILSPTFGLTISRLFVESYPLLFVAAAPMASGKDLRPRQVAALILYNLIGLAVLVTVAPN